MEKLDKPIDGGVIEDTSTESSDQTLSLENLLTEYEKEKARVREQNKKAKSNAAIATALSQAGAMLSNYGNQEQGAPQVQSQVFEADLQKEPTLADKLREAKLAKSLEELGTGKTSALDQARIAKLQAETKKIQGGSEALSELDQARIDKIRAEIKRMDQKKGERSKDPNSEASKNYRKMLKNAGAKNITEDMSEEFLHRLGREILKGAQREDADKSVMDRFDRREQQAFAKDIYRVRKDFLSDNVVKKLREQNVSFSEAESLLQAMENDNKVALGPLGTKMARAMGEVGVLTDTDVVRYISSEGVGRRVLDFFTKKKQGKLSDLSTKDLRDINAIMKLGAGKRLGKIREDYIDAAYQNFGVRYGSSRDEIAKKIGATMLGAKEESSSKKPSILKKQYSPSRNKTKIIYADGTEEIVDGKK